MYRAPLKDLSFVLNELLGAQPLAGCPAHADYSADLAESVLSESARFAEGVLEPHQPQRRSGGRALERGGRASRQGLSRGLPAVRRGRLAAAAGAAAHRRPGRAAAAGHGRPGDLGVGEPGIQAVSDADLRGDPCPGTDRLRRR